MPFQEFKDTLEAIHKTLRRLMVSTVILYLAIGTVCVLGYLISNRRIDDIQKSRVTSCIRTYTGIGEVFEQFTPPPPRTDKQQADIDKFNATINRLKARCIVQTKP